MATSASRPAAVQHHFESVFDELFAQAYALAFAMVGEALLAEEITVEALARTRVDWRRIVRRGRPDGDVARVVTMLAIDALARREPVLPVDTAAVAIDLTVDEALDLDHARTGDDREHGEAANPAAVGVRLDHDEARALRALPRRRREVVALWCYAGFAKPDVAEILGMSLAAVDDELELARGPLQRALEGEPAGDAP